VKIRTDGPPEVPGYQVLEMIGAGGMGEVYRARQLSLDRTVAIKFLNSLSPVKAGAGPRQRESRLMAALAHPHVVAVHDCGRAGERDYLVMEYVRGVTLRARMELGRAWSPAEALPVLDAVADALTYIHAQGILHLDLKPENVLCDERGRVRVTDFGLAVPEVDAAALSALGAAYHTLDYCPPEQRFGLPVDARADLFALGVIAYELLTGRLPGRVYVPASRARPGLPPAVDEALRRALERDPDDRYTSVAEFRLALGRALAPPRRNSLRTAVLVAALALTSATSLALYLTRDNRPAPERADLVAAPDDRAWIVFDRPDDQRLFEGVPDVLVPRAVAAHGLRPAEGGPPLPTWPEPRPALILASPGALGFVHPLENASLAARLARDWERLRTLPPVSTADNFMHAPPPGAARLSASGLSWHLLPESNALPDRGALYSPMEDGAGRTALTLVNRAAADSPGAVRCYQWSATLAVRDGTVMVLRYRARAEEGAGRLYVGMHHPVNLPGGEHGPVAERLRQASRPHPYLEDRPGEEELDYQVADWVTPGSEWQTYYSVWEWPPFARGAAHRNVWTGYVGEGKVWIDQVEMFPWELPSTP
jgi:hypothetical protein